jgi:hypothetical protein
MSEYEDICVLHKTGSWPNQQVPKWACEAAVKLHCGAANPAVIEIGLMAEIKRLQAKCDELTNEIAFWCGESLADDDAHTAEEREHHRLCNVPEKDRTPEQLERLRELARYLLHTDKDFWWQRAAKAEAQLERLRTTFSILAQSREPDGSIDPTACVGPESYEWLADEVESYSDVENDYMAFAANEFRKVAEAMRAAERD